MIDLFCMIAQFRPQSVQNTFFFRDQLVVKAKYYF